MTSGWVARHRRSLALALAAVLLSLGAPAAEGHFNPKKAMWGPVRIHGRSAFPLYHRLGVGVYEIALGWDQVAPTRPKHPEDPQDPAYRWPADIGYALTQARKYHMRLTIMVLHAPRWANGGHDFRWCPRGKDYARFVAAAARKYPTVHLWMIWGEPSRKGQFMPELSAKPDVKLTRAQAVAPHLYARLVDAAYGALKKLSRLNLVIAGNTFTTGDIYPAQWIENMKLPDGRPPRMDMYGHNPFGTREPRLTSVPAGPGAFDFSDLGRLATLVDRRLARRPGQHLPLFISEYGIPTAPDDQFNFYTDRAIQARWIRAAFKIVNRWSRIYAMGWINVIDNPPNTNGGLLDRNLRPKPGYYAFKAG